MENGDNKYLFNVVTNLIKCHYSFDVYVMYVVIKAKKLNGFKPKVFKGRKPKYLENFDIKYHNLLQSLDKDDYFNICVVLSNMTIDHELFNAITKYFYEYKGVNDIKSEKLDTYYECFEKNELDGDKLKYILGIIFLCKTNAADINHKKMFILINETAQEYVNNLSDYSNMQSYDILLYKRIYPVDPIIGVFHLARRNLGDEEELRYILAHNWLFYASNCPLWLKILNEVAPSWQKNNSSQEIIFRRVEEEDTFYEAFCLEHDEQPRTTQEMCTREIDKKSSGEFFQTFATYIHTSLRELELHVDEIVLNIF
jgi:hypothetical protein